MANKIQTTKLIRELVKEYNATCGLLFEIDQTHIKDIKESDYD